jgi:hypothetical protein
VPRAESRDERRYVRAPDLLETIASRQRNERRQRVRYRSVLGYAELLVLIEALADRQTAPLH